MTLLESLERRFRRYALPNVTVGLIVVQVAVYLLSSQRRDLLGKIALVPAQVLEGEVWRLVTFVGQPPTMNLLFAFFFWYLFYLMGTTLEQTWGTFRYNLFLLIGYVATVAVSFVTPQAPASVAFLQGSVFLAFAYLYPNFQLMLFFLLPIRIKWLALLTWIGYFLTLVSGPWVLRLMVTASILNFLVFFGKDLVLRMRGARRRMQQQAKRIQEQSVPRHCCAICGITNRSHPQEDFRYCSKCSGSPCYCEGHLKNHQHVTKEDHGVTP